MDGEQLILPLKSAGITLDELTALQESAPWPDSGSLPEESQSRTRTQPARGPIRHQGPVSRETYRNILRARTVREVSAAFRGERISAASEAAPATKQKTA